FWRGSESVRHTCKDAHWETLASIAPPKWRPFCSEFPAPTKGEGSDEKDARTTARHLVHCMAPPCSAAGRRRAPELLRAGDRAYIGLAGGVRGNRPGKRRGNQPPRRQTAEQAEDNAV